MEYGKVERTYAFTYCRQKARHERKASVPEPNHKVDVLLLFEVISKPAIQYRKSIGQYSILAICDDFGVLKTIPRWKMSPCVPFV